MRKYFIIFSTIFTFLNVKAQAPKVKVIYPTSDSIPANILRFYIQFSAPMQEMDILKHIRLKNEEGKNITGVFFENQYELWNSERTVVTLIIDPGRVKLGLFANNKMGSAFDEGEIYTLTVDSLLLDFNNQKLEKYFTKRFLAVKGDRLPPDARLWELDLPKSNTKQAVSIHFKDKIDHISAQTLIKIVKDKKVIKGKIVLQNQEQVGLFIPDNKWEKGGYQIIVNKKLEDISANAINQIFDHKPSNNKQNDDDDFSITFTIK